MNERIQELMKQARLHAKTVDADFNPQEWMDEYHKKFAELIVEECNQYALRNWEHGHLLGQDLKIHFGFVISECKEVQQ